MTFISNFISELKEEWKPHQLVSGLVGEIIAIGHHENVQQSIASVKSGDTIYHLILPLSRHLKQKDLIGITYNPYSRVVQLERENGVHKYLTSIANRVEKAPFTQSTQES